MATNKFEITDDLINLLQKGDRSTFKRLFDYYAPIFKGICFRYTGSNEKSDDIIQDVFVKIFRKASSYNSEGNFEGWMKRIVVNSCLDYVRREKRFDLSLEESPLESATSWDVPLADMGVQELVEVIDKLPTGLKAVFNLNVFEGLSHREIGEQLNISESASRAQLAKAKAKLKIELTKLNIWSASA